MWHQRDVMPTCVTIFDVLTWNLSGLWMSALNSRTFVNRSCCCPVHITVPQIDEAMRCYLLNAVGKMLPSAAAHAYTCNLRFRHHCVILLSNRWWGSWWGGGGGGGVAQRWLTLPLHVEARTSIDSRQHSFIDLFMAAMVTDDESPLFALTSSDLQTGVRVCAVSPFRLLPKLPCLLHRPFNACFMQPQGWCRRS